MLLFMCSVKVYGVPKKSMAMKMRYINVQYGLGCSVTRYKRFYCSSNTMEFM